MSSHLISLPVTLTCRSSLTTCLKWTAPTMYRHSVHLIALIRKGLRKLTDRNGIYFLPIFAKVISLKAVEWTGWVEKILGRGERRIEAQDPFCFWGSSKVKLQLQLGTEHLSFLIHRVIKTRCQSNTPETTEGSGYPFHKEAKCHYSRALHLLWLHIISFVMAPGSVTFSCRSRELAHITIENLWFWQMKHKDPLVLTFLKVFFIEKKRLAYIHMAQRFWKNACRHSLVCTVINMPLTH